MESGIKPRTSTDAHANALEYRALYNGAQIGDVEVIRDRGDEGCWGFRGGLTLGH